MYAHPEMLRAPAEGAKMKVPENIKDYDKTEYPHFYVYATMQLGRRMVSWRSGFVNAEIVARISEDDIRTMTPFDIIELGFE